MVRSIAVIALAGVPSASGDFRANYETGTPFANAQRAPTSRMYGSSLSSLDLHDLENDIMRVMKHDTRHHWPMDFGDDDDGNGGHYGGLFVRLAWHCSGTYRQSDGKGGCAGGGQRFEPLRSWDDNTNLDKARALLAPVKLKHGDKLSWGDLIVAAGTMALKDMGAPIQQYCFGRMDDTDGKNSQDLDPRTGGPPCEPFDGKCNSPLGATTEGLIYVNPEGPVLEEGGPPVPDPALSAIDIRNAFSRMGDSDRDTVALIGGGHAVGKCHGACDKPGAQGRNPREAFEANEPMAWQGQCGEGRMKGIGRNTFTSGFEGPWSTTPTQWNNEFFRNLRDWKWEVHVGPGGHHQWRVVPGTPGSDSGTMRLTTDIALLHDDSYRELVREFAEDEEALGRAFSDAWFKLTHRGGSWHQDSSFCNTGSVPQWVLDQNNNRMLDSDAVSV